MSTFRHAWTSLLSWVAAPFQVGLALVIVLLVITKVIPRLIRGGGVILHAGWTPALAFLTYPEFLITSTFRRYEWRLLPGTHAYGRTLGALARLGTRLGQWLRTRFTKPPRFPWKTSTLVVALLASCWYLAPKVPAGGVRTVLGVVNTDSIHTSSWLATGQWVSNTTSVSACTPATHAAHPVHKQKGKHKRKRKK
jgi:hypothetical protein